jgi:hypothetical protein
MTDMSYMPEAGVGYFYSINSANGDAFNAIGVAIRGYVTRGLTRQPEPALGQLPAGADEYVGWYEPVSMRSQMFEFLAPLLGLHRLRFVEGKLVLTSIGIYKQTFIPVSGSQFREVQETGPPQPIATAVLLIPNPEGRFVFLGTLMRRVPTSLAIMRIVLTAWSLLAGLSVHLYAPFWVLGGLSKNRRRPAERAVRLWPLIAVLSLLTAVVIYILALNDVISRLGKPTIWSFGIFVATLIFGVASLASACALWLAREVRSSVRGFSLVVVSALLITAVYLAYWGVIGIRTWA